MNDDVMFVLMLCCIGTIVALAFGVGCCVRLIAMHEEMDQKLRTMEYRINSISAWTKPLAEDENRELEARLMRVSFNGEGGFATEVNRERAADQNRT